MRRFFLVERAIFGEKNLAMMFCRSSKAFIFQFHWGDDTARLKKSNFFLPCSCEGRTDFQDVSGILLLSAATILIRTLIPSGIRFI